MKNLVFIISFIFILGQVVLTFAEEPLKPENKALGDSLVALFNSGEHLKALEIIVQKQYEDSLDSEYFRKLGDRLGYKLSTEEGVVIAEEILKKFPELIRNEAGIISCYLELNNQEKFREHLKSYHQKGGMGDFYEEYNHNILAGLDSNAIIFTNGDMDTYPAWYWQYIEGFRTDVTVVNLSLLNKPSMIKLWKNSEPKIPMSLSEEEIDKLNNLEDPALLKKRYLPEGKLAVEIKTPEGIYQWEIPATRYEPTKSIDSTKMNFLRNQDLIVMNIIEANQGKRPIYFAVTCYKTNRIGLDQYLAMEGLAFKLSPQKEQKIAQGKMQTNLFEKYIYKTCQDFPNIRHEQLDKWYRGPLYPPIEGEVRNAQNYRSAFLQLAYYYYQKKDESGGETPKEGITLEKQYQMFDKLSNKAKTYLILKKMEEAVPECNIPFTNEEVRRQYCKMLEDVSPLSGK
jgi:hypothetical protein